MKISGRSGGPSTLWRVVHLISKRRPYDPGPWHEQRDHALGWATWLRLHGQDVFVQSSAGDIYDGRKLIVPAARLH